MFCKNCGTQLPNDSKFCTTCGTPTDYAQPNATPYTNQGQHEATGNPNVIPALAYIPILFWLPLANEPKTPFGKACANQGLVALISLVALSIVSGLISTIFGSLFLNFWNAAFIVLIRIINLVFAAAEIAVGACCIIGLVKALSGVFFEIPLIGKIKLLK